MVGERIQVWFQGHDWKVGTTGGRVGRSCSGFTPTDKSTQYKISLSDPISCRHSRLFFAAHTHTRKQFRTQCRFTGSSTLLSLALSQSTPLPRLRRPFQMLPRSRSFRDHAQPQHRGARRARCVSGASLFYAGNPTRQILTSVWEASACPRTLPRTFSHPGRPNLERRLRKGLRVRPEGHCREGARGKRTRRQGWWCGVRDRR
jgi:hypothetical protein